MEILEQSSLITLDISTDKLGIIFLAVEEKKDKMSTTYTKVKAVPIGNRAHSKHRDLIL
jgi:hypothetical protein